MGWACGRRARCRRYSGSQPRRKAAAMRSCATRRATRAPRMDWLSLSLRPRNASSALLAAWDRRACVGLAMEKSSCAYHARLGGSVPKHSKPKLVLPAPLVCSPTAKRLSARLAGVVMFPRTGKKAQVLRALASGAIPAAVPTPTARLANHARATIVHSLVFAFRARRNSWWTVATARVRPVESARPLFLGLSTAREYADAKTPSTTAPPTTLSATPMHGSTICSTKLLWILKPNRLQLSRSASSVPPTYWMQAA